VATDAVQGQLVHGWLRHQDYELHTVSDPKDMFQAIHNGSLDLVLIGSLSDDAWKGVEWVQQLRRHDSQVPIILLAAQSTEELAIAALRAGATDYIKLSGEEEALRASVHRCLHDGSSMPAPRCAKPQGAYHTAPGLLGESPAIQEIRAYIGRVAVTESNILITGETGTGKEIVTGLLHKQSLRRQQPLVCVNCAAIPDGLVESELFGYERGAFTGANTAKAGILRLAHGGTVFLDEIGDMNLCAQAKILRTIEQGELQPVGGKRSVPVDIRIIAATNQQLEQRVAKGEFRADLFFRLNVAHIHLPPLRDRKEDIPLLCAHFLTELNHRFGCEVEGLAAETTDLFLRYTWPGNVRELKHLLEGAFINRPLRQIAVMDLPDVFRRRFQETVALPRDERERLLSALFSTKGNKSKAAEKLQWSRMTLYRKMAKYQLVH
jgi:DNA-binding NtrC family response regulator